MNPFKLYLLFFFVVGCSHSFKQEHHVARTLDELHSHAAQANGKEYFQLFHPKAKFIGTDPSEVWTLEEFKEYALPFFNEGKGWTYVATKREVSLSSDGNYAWFVERLKNEMLGTCRGTGVLEKTSSGAWRILQYNLSIPIPNKDAKWVVQKLSRVGKR